MKKVPFILMLSFLSGVGCTPPSARTTLAPLPDSPMTMTQPLEVGLGSAHLTPEESIDFDENAAKDPWRVSSPRPWKYIVIHHSATEKGSAGAFDTMHRSRGYDELGYHFVIANGNGEQDGLVQVGSRWTHQKWGAHCGGTPGNEYNNFGIGICLVGNFQQRLPSEKQLASLNALVRYLTATYHIPRENIITHRDAPLANTLCPGDQFHRYFYETFRPSLTCPVSR